MNDCLTDGHDVTLSRLLRLTSITETMSPFLNVFDLLRAICSAVRFLDQNDLR